MSRGFFLFRPLRAP
ncbi:MAG TPA: hypothetical protein DDY62_00630 [Cryomorphaceae bacterium]|nr:hypothetical protein [Cryomorphaceae bacterium]